MEYCMRNNREFETASFFSLNDFFLLLLIDMLFSFSTRNNAVKEYISFLRGDTSL